MSAGSIEPARLHVDVSGDGGGPVLFLHGFGATGFTWRQWIPLIDSGRRILVADLKGHGKSPKPRDGRYSPHDQAAAVSRLLDDYDLGRVTLVGHSLGGGIALLTAIKLLRAGRLDRLSRLVLVASAAVPQALPPFVRLARVPGLNLATIGTVPPRHIVRWVLRQIVFDPRQITDGMVEGYALPLTDSASRRALLATARQIVPPDVDDLVAEYARLQLPTLLLWGEQDPVVPPWVGRRLAELLPDATLVTLPQCGHLPAEEQPERSFEPVSAFLEADEAAP